MKFDEVKIDNIETEKAKVKNNLKESDEKLKKFIV